MDETNSHEVLVDFGKICRLCLTGDGVLISLFSTDSVFENGNKSVPDKIMDLMSILISKNDGFPSWICHNCLSQVDKCFEFFDQCRKNQAALRESYFTALTEAGVSLSSVEVQYQGGKYKQSKSEDKLIAIYNNYPLNSSKKEVCEINDEGGGRRPGKEIFLIKAEEEEEEEEEETIGEETPNKDYYCNVCSKEFASPDEFYVHQLITHRGENVITRDEGDVETNHSKSNLSELYGCDACDAKFYTKNAMAAHVRFKHLKSDREQGMAGESEKLGFCKYCGLSFSRKNGGRHLEIVHRMTKNVETDHRDVGSFDCRICFRPFLRQSSLRSHIEKVHGDNLEIMAEVENCEIVWNCSECDAVFLEEVHLMQHYGSKHSKYPLEMDALRGLKSKSLICPCGVIASNSFDSTLHSIFGHPEEMAKEKPDCLGCDKTFADLEELKVHLISYHWFFSMTYENECAFCGRTFKSNDSLRRHLGDSHQIDFEKNSSEENRAGRRRKEGEEGEDNSACEGGGDEGAETEGASLQDSSEACEKTAEEVENHGDSACLFSHRCKLCGKGYKTSNHLKRHVTDFHNTMSPIKCPLCPKIFPRKMNLHHHYKRRHLKQTKKFVCSYCGQSLKGIVALRSHEDRLHRNVRNYKCPDCPEAFTTRGILRKHAQRHLAERPMLQCQFCEKKFSTISGIERHIKTHEGVKEFVCETPLCGKSFYTKSELKRHVKFHTRDFKHVCPVCDHKFMSPGELKKHSTKHTGERPFKCHLCSCAYARRDDKVKHLKRVHNLKVKRVYGKSLIKSADQDSELVDTIVIDDGACAEGKAKTAIVC